METKELHFPITFKACPNCGGERRVANEVMQGEKDKRKIGEKADAFTFRHQSLIMDTSKAALVVPLLLTFFDVCVECGTVYCVRADVQMIAPRAGGPQLYPGAGIN